MSNLNKEEKWLRNRKRLIDALISNAYNNQVDQMLEKLTMLGDDGFEKCKNSLLYSALKNASKECAEILIQRGATCNINLLIRDCYWYDIDRVYSLVEYLIKKYNIEIVLISKEYIVTRLIDPSKIKDNPGRLEYTIQLLRDGFFNINDIRKSINKSYKDNNKRGNITSLIREISLNDLGI